MRVSTWTGIVPWRVGSSGVALLTSRATLIATSLFKCTVGCTSSFRPTSRYVTLSVITGPWVDGTEVALMIGTR
ncbi:hypothetical protein D3C73_1581410 [compost metagenome]